MPIPASINDLSTTQGSNSPAGSETPTDGDGYLRAHAAFIATLRDQLNGTANTGTVKNATFSGTMAGAASWSSIQSFLAGFTVTAGGNVDFGTYTPTLTGVANITSSTSAQALYLRLGSIVVVAGALTVTTTTSVFGSASKLGISLPIASNLASVRDCSGVSCTGDVQTSNAAASVIGDATNDRAEFNWSCGVAGTPIIFAYVFFYRIL